MSNDRTSLVVCGAAALGLLVASSSDAQTIPRARADVDRNCVVTRADATIVQSLLGRRTGQAGFNPAADVDQNGTINNVDVTFVSRNIGATVCSTNRQPVITSAPVTSALLLAPYSYSVVATDADLDPLTFSLPTAPPGMTIDPATGAIHWTPPGLATLNVVVRVVDGHGGAATQAFTVTVSRPANRSPHLTAPGNRRIPAGVPFRLGLSADDPDPGDSLSFALLSGPAGAVLSPSPIVAWTPGQGQVGVHPFSVRVQDAAGASDSGSFSIEVVGTNGAPVLDAQADATIPAGAAFSRIVTAADPNLADVLTYALVAGPTGLTLSSDGTLTWTPTSAQLGAHLVKLAVADGTGLGDAAAFTLTVEVPAVTSPPVAVDDRYAVRRQAALSVPAPGLLANDSDPAGRALTAQMVSQTTKGVATLAPEGALSYTPAAPASGSTAPRLAYTVSHNEGGLTGTYSQPLVADLDGDGEAEIVFLGVGGFTSRRLVAVHGSTGARAFSVNAYQPTGTPPIAICLSFCELAAGDLDRDGRMEILAVHSDNETSQLRRKIVAFNYDGTYRWTSDDIVDGINVTQTSGMTWINLADLDADGSPEIVVLHQGKAPSTPAGVIGEDLVTVFDRNGHIRWTKRVPGTASYRELAIADIDLDGTPEIVIGAAVLDNAGNVKWSVKSTMSGTGFLAVGNLDDDPYAEIVFQDRFANLYCYEHTGARKWGPIRQPVFSDFSAPSIGDVDGDGRAEIVRPADGVEVWDGNGNLVRVMSLPSPYLGYGGNATVFDLNGDGRPEVIYNGARGPHDSASVYGALYIFDGATGELLHTMQASRNGGDSGDSSGPIVADVTGDGAADIVTGGWGEQAILHVFTAATGRWAETRPIWNQKNYHVTNVGRDGRIPAREAVHWLTPGVNVYRGNVPLPEERTEDADALTYVASNGLLPSNVATVRIDILPPNGAPRILSTAPQAAARDIEYVYAVRAVDPDAGESLLFSLAIAPAGMTIDPFTGVVRWVPGASVSGSVTAVVEVIDSQGESDSQQFSIAVGAPTVVPEVIGQTVAAAQATLAAAGLRFGTTSTSPSATLPAGQVMSQEPAAGATVASGAAIDLVVSSGQAPTAIPNLVGKTESAALQQLDAFGLASSVVRGFSNTVPTGRVTAQSPPAGTLLVAGSVSVTVSAGPGLSLRLQRDLTAAGESIPFTASAYDLSYVTAPIGGLTFQITPAIAPFFGTLPTVVGSIIVTAADTRGAFRLTATDPATGRAVSADFGVTFPRVAGQASMTEAYAGLSDAIDDLDGLLGQARASLAMGDTAGIRSLLNQMVQRWRQVDTLQLRLTTPFGLPEGFFPAPRDLASLGLTPSADDLLAQEVLRDAASDLRAWTAGLREPSTSMSSLTVLANGFNTRAARLSSLTLSEWGAIKGAPTMTVILTELLPAFYDALTDELAVVVERSAAGPGPSTLAEQLVVQAVQHVIDTITETPLHEYKQAIFKQAAWSAAIVAAAHHFRAGVGAGNLDAIVAGASLSIHVFNAPWSFIEGNLDTDEPGNAIVITLGPEEESWLQESPDSIKGTLSTVANAGALYGVLNNIYGRLRAGAPSSPEGFGLVKKAFQRPGEGYKGCVFSSAPTCGQIVFGDGFNSVYEFSPPDLFDPRTFTGLPVPILFLVYDKTTGGVTVDTPEFLPTPAPQP